VRLTTDNGLTGVGEASLEWQERTVQTCLHEWVEERILGVDPVDLEATVDALVRDQYQGGPTVLSAISGVEVALWDLLGKLAGQPVYQLLGGRARERLPAYANGWYGRAQTAADYATGARQVVERGYRALKFDPFETAWKQLSPEQVSAAAARVRAVRETVGPGVEIFVEGHGRLSLEAALAIGEQLSAYDVSFFEEPVSPYDFAGLHEVRTRLGLPVAAGERLYMVEEFARLIALGAVDVVQPDLCHVGGLSVGRQIAALATAAGVAVAPHCSVGPVALCAAVHFGWATPAVIIQENFSEYDVPWRSELVAGWDLISAGEFRLPSGVGLGIELNDAACAAHPYQKNTFPSLWDRRWLDEFTRG
jgi:galactonate dehydratase